MCGICGCFGQSDRNTVDRMLATLVHRGPDDGHLVHQEDFAIGARRLSILDVEFGKQPLCDETGQIWAAQNGEIYNFPELRQLLESKGHKFKTRCDTEILPYLYQLFGMDFVTHLDGMFAVAIWDDRIKKGILARDRMGKKPLYYSVIGDKLYFASEIKAILAIPGFERRINQEALDCYLSFKHVPHPLSIFEGLHSLPPAHFLTFSSESGLKVQRYWDLTFASDPESERLSENEIVDEILRLLKGAVKRRLLSDVPVGFFLSGGIDSSLSTAIAAEETGQKLKTFTLAYDGGSTTKGKEADRYWSSWVSRKYDTEHHEEVIEFASFPERIKQLIGCFDEPFCGTMSTYFLAGAISKHVKVALSGDGADELFGSYLSHRLAIPVSNYQRYLESGDSRLISPFESNPDTVSRFAAKENWPSDLFVYTRAEKQKLYSSDYDAEAADRRHRRDYSSLSATDPLNCVLEAEYRNFFPDQVLTFVDRLSMAHSLEVRSAFLDTELVKFVCRLPGFMKIQAGETKYLLKQLAKRYFPDEMVFRPKEGFIMPVTNWILNDLQVYVRETLSPERLNRHGIFDIEQVRASIEALYDSDRPKHYTEVNKVLSLLIFQEWYDLYLGSIETQTSNSLSAEKTLAHCAENK